MFGPATTLTADGPVEYLLHKSSGRKWVNVDVELETGCGIVPYTYKEKAAVAALQWVVGLELFLLSADPWRMVLSTDHPERRVVHGLPGADPPADGPQPIATNSCKRVNQKLLAGSALADGIAREYTLNEIAIVTRAGPARLLGLTRKGHLGIGADADVTVYVPTSADCRGCSRRRATSSRAASLVVEEGQLRRAPAGRRLHVRPGYDARRRARPARASSTSYAHRVVRQLSGRPAARRAVRGLADIDRAALNVEIRGVFIEDTFAEAFGMRAARVVITATHAEVGA